MELPDAMGLILQTAPCKQQNCGCAAKIGRNRHRMPPERLFQAADDSGGNAATVERFKCANEHFAGLAKFFRFASATPEQFQSVQRPTFWADTFYCDAVAQLKKLFIYLVDTIACLTFHG
jgi:hypothetical protein